MRDALAAEWSKLWTQHATAWLMLATVTATIGISAAACELTHISSATVGGDSTKLSLVGVQLGQLVLATFAILTITEEYANGMIHVTFSAMPDRSRVLAAKAANVAELTVGVGLIATVGCLAAGRLLLPGAGVDPAHGYALVSVASRATVRAAIGTVMYLLAVAMLSLGVATVLRETATAIGAVFGLLFLPPIIAHIVGGAAGRHIEQVSPMTAGLGIQATTRLHSLPIAPWAGLGVCGAWACASLALAAAALRIRDA